MSTVVLRIGGVPEHFNFPWRLAHSALGFQATTVDFTWTDYYGGTGVMREDLHRGDIDLAVMLTEGAVADINEGPGLKIVGQYVSSPLHWGVHVHSELGPASAEQLIGHPFAISRRGSGSHLMAYVYAKQKGWDPGQLRFVDVQDLAGARRSLGAGESTVFLWERFTTAPVVDAGEWRCIDICSTPWPSFVVVGREDVLKAHPHAVEQLLAQMHRYLTETAEQEIIHLIHQDLDLKLEDLRTWLAQTEWDCQPRIRRDTLMATESTLAALGLADHRLPPEAYVAPFTQLL
ncbi:MAG: ABC transporter substrate-binding protein [Pseudomonadota bacterium]